MRPRPFLFLDRFYVIPAKANTPVRPELRRRMRISHVSVRHGQSKLIGAVDSSLRRNDGMGAAYPNGIRLNPSA